ncbi:flexible cuticle protein 12-like [Sitodiplosis mosellana]|uniref:flexible cuticle protein 12-like n=1 Tax=Sitodiplosis mosellana TaxID=263140 RepID=UPI0024439FAB|nr:flexible cuticle protein 12-like [Sitodiplosis mosellana]
MKSLIVLAVLVAVIGALPVDQDHAAIILKSENTNIGVDNWKWLSETSNGIAQQESGEIVDRGSKQEGIAVRGSFTYTDPITKQQFTVTYVADKNGFQPTGSHLPVPPQA